jgi:hypothetical protein
MRKARFWRLAVIITTAGGLSLAGAGTALAGGGARSDLAVTIETASAFVQVSHDTLVRYGAPAPAGTATVSGSVTGIPAHLTSVVVTLLAKPFGATTFTGTGRQAKVRPAADGSAGYSFPVTPDLATSYEVAASETGAGTPLATSVPRTVYVIADVTATVTKCSRPTCTGTLVVTARFPPSAFKTESVKHLWLYGGLRQSAGSTPAGPDKLRLEGWARTAVPDPGLSTIRYNVGFQFSVGPVDGYQWKINYCTRDTEASDGIGLPGPHDCGDPVVSATAPYLG